LYAAEASPSQIAPVNDAWLVPAMKTNTHATAIPMMSMLFFITYYLLFHQIRLRRSIAICAPWHYPIDIK
jgi:hypothetical protein